MAKTRDHQDSAADSGQDTNTHQEESAMTTTIDQDSAADSAAVDQEQESGQDSGQETETEQEDSGAVDAAPVDVDAVLATLAAAIVETINASAESGGAVRPIDHESASGAVRAAVAAGVTFDVARAAAEDSARGVFVAAVSDGRAAHALSGGMLTGWLSNLKPADTKAPKAARVVDPIPAAVALAARNVATYLSALAAVRASQERDQETAAVLAALTDSQRDAVATQLAAIVPPAGADDDSVTAFVRQYSRATKASGGAAAPRGDGQRQRIGRSLAALPAGLSVTWTHQGSTFTWTTDGAGHLTDAAGNQYDTPGAAVSGAVPGINGVNAWRELKVGSDRLAAAHDAALASQPATPAADTTV